MFTCITDTGSLTWDINGTNEVFYQEGQLSGSLDIFTLNLISVSGMMFVSTATAHNVSIESDGKALSCSDNNQTKSNLAVTLSGKVRPLEMHTTLCFQCKIVHLRLSIRWSPPLLSALSPSAG